jgi:hypothetical protein
MRSLEQVSSPATARKIPATSRDGSPIMGDPQPGLHTWCSAVTSVIKQMAELVGFQVVVPKITVEHKAGNETNILVDYGLHPMPGLE